MVHDRILYMIISVSLNRECTGPQKIFFIDNSPTEKKKCKLGTCSIILIIIYNRLSENKGNPISAALSRYVYGAFI